METKLDQMTISQGLRRIKKLKGAFAEQLGRAQAAIAYEKDSPPAFAFTPSLEAADAARAELIAVETALRLANARTKIPWRGRSITLSEAICILRETVARIEWLKGLQGVLPREEMNREKPAWVGGVQQIVKYVFKCDLTEVKRAEWVQKEQELFDQLNDLVETTNHRTPLVETNQPAR